MSAGPATIPADGPAAFLRPGETVFVTAGPAEPSLLHDMLRRDPKRAADVTFRGVFIPGINGFDYAAVHPRARMEGIFPAPAFRAGIEAGRHRVRPLHYHEAARFLSAAPVDAAILHLSPPDSDGICSFGINADFAPLVAAHATRLVGFVNRAMPATAGETGIPLSRLDAVVEYERPPPDFPDAAPDAASEAIARHAAALIADGDTIQIGIGKTPTAILRALRGHRDLRFHTGMITDEVAALAEAGALAMDMQAAPIVTGNAIGTTRVHALAGDHARVEFRSALHTHAPEVLARLERFVSINSALSIDLLGQVNAERLGDRLVSATGGLVDFVRGARGAEGGRSILALPASAGRHSRIVPMLADGPVTVSRADIDIVVTEYGVARLRHLDVEARAAALIAIAAPDHRESLAEGWKVLRPRL